MRARRLVEVAGFRMRLRAVAHVSAVIGIWFPFVDSGFVRHPRCHPA
jgi:hypothetical protein